MTKLIFLDIDGVLNHELWFKSNRFKDIEMTDGDYDDPEIRLKNDITAIDPNSIILLNHLAKETKAKVVISSSWRKNRDLKWFIKLFKALGATFEIIGITPVMYYEKSDESVPRGVEIKAWLTANKDLLGEKQHMYSRYVILDDNSDMLLWQRHNYFRVDAYCGLTYDLIYRVTNFLNKK